VIVYLHAKFEFFITSGLGVKNRVSLLPSPKIGSENFRPRMG